MSLTFGKGRFLRDFFGDGLRGDFDDFAAIIALWVEKLQYKMYQKQSFLIQFSTWT